MRNGFAVEISNPQNIDNPKSCIPRFRTYKTLAGKRPKKRDPKSKDALSDFCPQRRTNPYEKQIKFYRDAFNKLILELYR